MDVTFAFKLTNADRGFREVVRDFPDSTSAYNAGLARLQRVQPHSWDHALRHEGWRLQVASGAPFPIEGTISHATNRPQDVMPRLVAALSDILDWASMQPFADDPDSVREMGQLQRQLGAIEGRMDGQDDEAAYWQTEECVDDWHELGDMIDEQVPDGYFCGIHPGDGSDVGIWPTDHEE